MTMRIITGHAALIKAIMVGSFGGAVDARIGVTLVVSIQSMKAKKI